MSVRARVIAGAAVALSAATAAWGGERLANHTMTERASHNGDAMYCADNYRKIVNAAGGSAVERCTKFENFRGGLPESAEELRDKHVITEGDINTRRVVDGVLGGLLGSIPLLVGGYIITRPSREERRMKMIQEDKSAYYQYT